MVISHLNGSSSGKRPVHLENIKNTIERPHQQVVATNTQHSPAAAANALVLDGANGTCVFFFLSSN